VCVCVCVCVLLPLLLLPVVDAFLCDIVLCLLERYCAGGVWSWTLLDIDYHFGMYLAWVSSRSGILLLLSLCTPAVHVESPD
jgi:hypothetical protein